MAYQKNGFRPPTPDEIADCAYLIWEKEGRPADRAREHWLQAESQLLICRAHEEWTGDPARRSDRPVSGFPQD